MSTWVRKVSYAFTEAAVRAALLVTAVFFRSSQGPLDAAWMHLEPETPPQATSQLRGTQRRLLRQLPLEKVHHLRAELVGAPRARLLADQARKSVALERRLGLVEGGAREAKALALAATGWPSACTRRTISYLTWTRSRRSKKSDETNSGSDTRSGCGLRQPSWRRAPTFGSGRVVLAIGSPGYQDKGCNDNYSVTATICQEISVAYAVDIRSIHEVRRAKRDPSIPSTRRNSFYTSGKMHFAPWAPDQSAGHG